MLECVEKPDDKRLRSGFYAGFSTNINKVVFPKFNAEWVIDTYAI